MICDALLKNNNAEEEKEEKKMLIFIDPDTDYMLLERSDQKTYASAVNYDDLSRSHLLNGNGKPIANIGSVEYEQ